MLRTVIVVWVLFASPVFAADFSFCWVGANGYTMTGRMIVPQAAMSKPLVTDKDVTAFKISGYHDGQLLGTWDMSQTQQTSTFHLRFDPATEQFLTGGNFPSPRSQGWNANGSAENCGNPGFGFNSGNYAQDICVNGEWIEQSGVAPNTPFRVATDAAQATCNAKSLISKSLKTNHSD